MDAKDQKFIREFEKKILGTIKKYKLASKKDRVIVAVSGGKDSTTVLYLLHKFGFKPQALFIDLDMGEWSDANMENIKKFCKQSGIKINIVSLKKEFGCGIAHLCYPFVLSLLTVVVLRSRPKKSVGLCKSEGKLI